MEYLQEEMNHLLGPLTKLFEGSIALRHVPQARRATKIVFITKPGKNGHVRAKYFRPISRTSIPLKTLNRLTDRFHRTGPNILWVPPSMPGGKAVLLRLHYTT